MHRFLLCFFLAIVGTSIQGANRPNVLFLAVDDMNDWIGCHGTSPCAITPNLDRLAARGVNFTNAHTAGVYCAPSRAAIFSGQHASTTGCYKTANYFALNPEIEALQMSFSKGGYTTLGAGKLFHHPAGAVDQRGWTEFFLRTQRQREAGWPMDSWTDDTPLPEILPASVFNRGQEMKGGLFLEWAPIPNKHEEEMADTKRINWAVKQLGRDHDEPFFLGVGIYAPHFPNYCPQKYFDLYDPAEIQLPPIKADDLDDLPEKIRKAKTGRSRIHQRLMELDAADDAIHGYLACISYADAMMGRVLDALDKSDHADDTIVVFWSDHGYHHGEKFNWGKHTLWERTSNVPFLWAGPGVAQGVTTDVTVSLIDLFPTLVEMCGLPQPAQTLDGTSIAATLADPASAKDRTVLLPDQHVGQYAVMNRDWRYIHYEDGEELYHLRDDPNEWHNIASKPEHAAVIEELRKSAPAKFAPPAENYNARRDLVVEGDTFRWEKGKGNAPQSSKEGGSKRNQPAPEKKKSGQANASASKQPNFLFIVCDDLNTHVGTSGYEFIDTPHLDAFARESQNFRNAYCQYPVCGPSRASFLSGLYPESARVLSNDADIRETRPGTVTMPQFLKENGYWTASTGKIFHNDKHDHGEVAWHEQIRFGNDELPVVSAARKKFEAENGSVEKKENRKAWKAVEKASKSTLDSQTPPGYGPTGLSDAQHKDGKNAAQVTKWLKEKSYGEKPFFIACGIHKPHVAFLAPDKYFEKYPLADIRYTPDRVDLWSDLPKQAISGRYKSFGFPELGKENDTLRREYMQAYHACVSFLDAQVGQIFAALKETGHWEDTVVVFTSDHGYHLGDHFLWGKVTLFDIGTRVPFLLRAPGLTEPGTTSEAMVELIDLYPTFAQLAKLDAPEHLQGTSLRPLLGHPERMGKKKYAYTVVSRGADQGRAIRNQRWRYAKWPDGGEELYNLLNDRGERTNLAARPEMKERLREMREVLEETRVRASP